MDCSACKNWLYGVAMRMSHLHIVVGKRELSHVKKKKKFFV